MSAKKETVNLIDLTMDEEVNKITFNTKSTETIPPTSQNFPDEFRKSLDNNPFDKAQRQVNYLDDPFEIVIQEVSQNCNKKRKEVETGNLLLMEEDILNNPSSEPAIPLKVSNESVGCSGTGSSFECDSSVFQNDCSKMIHSKNMLTEDPISDNLKKDELEILNTNQFSSKNDETCLEMCKNSETTISPGSGKSKNSKSAEYKKRLLKLSLSNSLIKSPLGRQSSKRSENSSPMTDICKEAERLAIKMSEMVFDASDSFDDSCDDLMSIEPKWVESEAEGVDIDEDSDIEMMNIPILKEINSLKKTKQLSETKKENDLKLSNVTSEDVVNNLPSKDIDLKTLREKVKSQRVENSNSNMENSNSNDPASLISNLKNIISECSSDTKKSEANSLLESLSNILNTSDMKENKPDTKPPPKPIIRQGTFDIDLKEKEDDKLLGGEPSKVQHNTNDDNQNEYNSPESNKSQKEEQNDFNSSEIVESDMSSIVEQIGRLLGNQNVNIVQANLTTPSKGIPTYIVVMNTPITQDKKRSILFTNQENSSPEPLLSNTMRRRSQSLSIHDKSKLAVIKPQHQNENKSLLSGGGFAARRNSFSTPPSQISTPCMSASARRSMYSLNRESSQKPTPRKLTLETHHEKYRSTSQVQIKPLATIKPEINPRTFKLKANECGTRPQGPLKATIPLKNPIAYSTPGNVYSPSKNLLKVKSRYSHLPVSPISRQSSTLPNRRRTISEIKSPRKRLESKTSIGISKPVIKPLKLTPGLSKAVNKLTPNKNSAKPIIKITDDNKENSKPSFK